MTQFEETKDSKKSREILLQELFSLSKGGPRFFALLVLFNYLITYLRPQDIFKPLGEIRFPLLVTLLCSLFFIKHFRANWTKATKILVGFVFYLGFYGFVGKVIDDSLIRNDFKSFFTWADLTMGTFGLYLPLSVLFLSRKNLSSFGFITAVISILLGLWTITHGGHGPGGWVGDENDCCLTLLTLFPFCFYFIQISKTLLLKTVYCLGALSCLAGIVSTTSRGGFIGLVLVLTYLFVRSRHKVRAVFFTIILIVIGALTIPSKYWEEMKTIKNVGEGTALKRTQYWSTALRVWLHPTNILIGVGASNSPFWLGDFQDAGAGTEYGGPSYAGREVHSLYFQLLPDLGLIGVFFVGSIFIYSFAKNRILLKHCRYLSAKIIRFKKMGLVIPEYQTLTNELYMETQFSEFFLQAVNTAFIGAFSAAAFISVLYYPPIWLLVGVGAAAQFYADKISDLFTKYENLLREENPLLNSVNSG